jgi:hypothetical protein
MKHDRILIMETTRSLFFLFVLGGFSVFGSLSGCSPRAPVTEAESQKQEAKDLQDAIEVIQKDTSLSAQEKERAISPHRQRLDRIPANDGK